MTTRAKRCACHCSGCGRHFNSVTAFDLHRRGPADARVCLSGAEAKLFLLSEQATCDVVSPSRFPVVLWSVVGPESGSPLWGQDAASAAAVSGLADSGLLL